MHKSEFWFTVVAVILALSVSAAYPTLAQAQCGGSGDGGNSHMSNMGNMGNMGTMMGSGQGGNYYPRPRSRNNLTMWLRPATQGRLTPGPLPGPAGR